MPQLPLTERPGVAQYFGRLAQTYGAGAYYGRRRAAVIAAMRDELRGAPRLLDLGCGNGANLFALRDALSCALIAGADLSRHMLAEADRRQRSTAARVPLLCADAMALPFGAAAWDAILCSHVLQMVPDVGECIRGISIALKPIGLLAIAAGGGRIGGQMLASLSDEQRAILGAGRRGGRARDPDLRNLDLIETSCEAAGFVVERKQLPFAITGAELAEWYRIRWIPVMEDSLRAEVERVLDQITAERGAEEFKTAETLLFARKQR